MFFIIFRVQDSASYYSWYPWQVIPLVDIGVNYLFLRKKHIFIFLNDIEKNIFLFF